ncbi:hypothetical protein [Citrobacter freundii]|uniref:Uncharacterized protein n=1 Tax=Citrobacter freundii TaxID=546 RepID=A0A7G2IJI9_CITFR|nr:hypothetical protein [Citrobacter freundii]
MAWCVVCPHISALGCKPPHTFGRSGEAKIFATQGFIQLNAWRISRFA